MIFVHRISDFRMGGISLKNFRTFRKLCGEQTLRNVVILTNMWSQVDVTVGEQRENELSSQDEFFKPALDKGAMMMRHDGTLQSAREVVSYILSNRPQALQIQREMVEENRDVAETSAADEMDRALHEQQEHQKEEALRVQKELEGAFSHLNHNDSYIDRLAWSQRPRKFEKQRFKPREKKRLGGGRRR